MKYLFINPITTLQYTTTEIDRILEIENYKRVYITEDWISITKNKYKDILRGQTKPVVDMRCPVAAHIAKEFSGPSKLLFPNIEPILIHCARELSTRKDLADGEKIITTPCRALAEMGNKLKLPNTKFYTWNDFLTLLGKQELSVKAKKTPIPLGFFIDLTVKQISLTGKSEIQDFFTSHKADNYQLIEMLYCKDGCHNGDGVSA